MTVQQILDQFNDPSTVLVQGQEPTVNPPAVAQSEGAPALPLSIDEIASRERAKLYPELNKAKSEADAAKARVAELEAREAVRVQEEAARNAAEAERLRIEEESRMSDIERLTRRVEETQARLEQETRARETAQALFEQEQRYSQLQSYRSQRVEQSRDSIDPNLIDFVGGNTEAEIDESIAVLQAKTASILDSVNATYQQQRQSLQGVRITNPAGPQDNSSEHQRFNDPQALKEMTAAEYAKNRHLINPGAIASSRGQGLFDN